MKSRLATLERLVAAGLLARELASSGEEAIKGIGDLDMWMLFHGSRSVEGTMAKCFKDRSFRRQSVWLGRGVTVFSSQVVTN